jgi:hypothetical protein
MLYLNLLEKQEKSKCRMIKIRAEIPKKLYKESMKQKCWFFENINKVDKPLVNLTKRRREKTQINKNTDEKGILQ